MVKRLSEATMCLVDGLGTERFCNYLLAKAHEISLRMAGSEDAGIVFNWRNHPVVRQQSFSTKPLEWDDHLKWFDNILRSRDVALMIAEQSENPVGVIRYDISGHEAAVSIYLDPAFVGLGIGTAILMEGTAWIRRNRPEVKRLTAEVKLGNEASERAFLKSGFVEAYHGFELDLTGDSDHAS